MLEHAGARRASVRRPDAAKEARWAARHGHLTTHTSGLAPDFLQGNVVMLPRAHAGEFLRYCTHNPKACPLLSISEPGDTCPPGLGVGIDIRTDLPRYRIFEGGQLIDEPLDVLDRFRADLVTFVLGCSFSFERALLDADIQLKHIAQGRNVPMFRTHIPTRPVGGLAGPLVVSMRPMRASDAIRAVQITTHFRRAHGAPVHLGDPAAIGIGDLSRPDFGDPVELSPGELPVFWACGVTPQLAVQAAQLDLCITHYPGSMLVTDVPTHVMLDW